MAVQKVLTKKNKKTGSWTSYLLLPGVIVAVALAVLVGMFVYVYSKRSVARIIDNIPITERQIGIEIDNLKKENSSFKPPTNASQAEIDEAYKTARSAALTRRTNMALIELEAREKKLDDVAWDEIQQRMDEALKSAGMTEEQYLVELNISRQDFIDQTREIIIYERVTKDIYASVSEPTKDNLKQYFDNIKDMYQIGETADFYMCMVKNMDDGKKVLESIEQDQKKGLKLEAAMANAVKKFSTDADSKKTDGKMIDIPKEYFNETPEVANAIFPSDKTPQEAQLSVGIVQPIITQKKGVYIILLLKKNPPQKPDLDGSWKLYNTETKTYDTIKIFDMVKQAWMYDQGQAKVTKHLNDLSNKHEDLIYDRVKGNLPWSGLEKFYQGILGTTVFNRIMGWEE
ncbi:MAG: peptidylprolyl isomerase [Caldisericia bacterium]|nr:peptidylprolyl isomerase [Caldisericia bacterium]